MFASCGVVDTRAARRERLSVTATRGEGACTCAAFHTDETRTKLLKSTLGLSKVTSSQTMKLVLSGPSGTSVVKIPKR